MRIAAMILGLVLSVAWFAQAMLVYVAANVADDEAISQGSAVGVVGAFLLFLGGAFALGLPRVAAVLFVGSSLFAVMGASGGEYGDLWVWAVVGFSLAAMAFLGYRGKRRSERNAAVERESEMRRAVAAGVAAAQRGEA